MQNPFIFGAELEPGQLVDREEEVRQVVGALTGRQKLFLIGPRRFGKTSILNVAESRAREQGAMILRHDAEAYPTYEDLVSAIVANAARQLTSLAAKAGEQVVKLFSALRPKVTYDGSSNTWTAGIGLGETHKGEPQQLLVDALDGVARMAESLERPVAVIIDEFQHLVENGGAAVERQLRATIQRHTQVAYVFAGSKTSLLNDMTLNPARPFYRLGGRLFLGPVPRDDFGKAIRRGFAKAKFTVDDAAVERIFDLAEDVPYNVQALANMAWETVRADGRQERLTVAVVERALDRLVAQDGPFYSKLWNLCTQTQQRALIAVAAMHGRGLHGAEVLQRFRMVASTMTKSLAALESRDIIRREDAFEDTRWKLEDPFFAVWLVKVGAISSGPQQPLA